jgi:hypothetical protein
MSENIPIAAVKVDSSHIHGHKDSIWACSWCPTLSGILIFDSIERTIDFFFLH